jgi:predicted nucleic acid-binding protein
MMSERFVLGKSKISDATLKRGLLFDTNVWLLLHGTVNSPTDWRIAPYSGLYKRAMEIAAPIHVLQTVISEFVNVSLHARARLANWGKEAGKIHQQPDHPVWIKDVSEEVCGLMEGCTPIDDNFSSLQLSGVFSSCLSTDFNDALIASACIRMGAVLVTHDIDFQRIPVPIISANKKYLQAAA